MFFGGEGGEFNVGCTKGINKFASCVHFVTAVDPDILPELDEPMASNMTHNAKV